MVVCTQNIHLRLIPLRNHIVMLVIKREMKHLKPQFCLCDQACYDAHA